MPAAASRARVAGEAGSTSMPRMPSWSTAMAAPPPVVVTMPTRRGAGRPGSSGILAASGWHSISDSRMPTRAMPQPFRKASATSSSPASAPVWVSAISAAAAERPSL